MGVQAAVHSEDGKNQGRVGQTKVKRYWPGRAPDWVEEGGEEEELVQEQQEERSRTSVAAPVVVKKADDPRLARLADARSVRAPEVVRRRRHESDEEEEEEEEEEDDVEARKLRHRLHRAEVQDDEGEEEGSGQAAAEEEDGKARAMRLQREDEASGSDEEDDEDEEDEEANALRRQMLKARLQERQQLRQGAEEAAAAEVEGEEEESEEDSEYETDSDDEDTGRQMLKPVFVSKADRETIKEKERLQQEAEAAAAAANVRKEERKAETRDIVIETIKREEEAEHARPAKEDHEINTDDDNDEEAEFEAWKQRELARIKRARDAKEKAEKEAAERERLKNMTEEERAAWELANPKVAEKKDKSKWNFMQKYWHKGAYFQESADGKVQTGKDEIFRRDFSAPTGEDKFDKSLLPAVMQVKNFGRSGRSKWTHLTNEDTTDFSGARFDDGGAVKRTRQVPQEFSRPKKLKT